MAQHISPGVYTKIIDLSEFVQNVPSTIGFICIISEHGPDNQLIFTNARDFYLDFGRPDITYAKKAFGQGPYVADSFLKQSDSLYVVRCLPTDAAYSNLILMAERAGEYGADGTASAVATSEAGVNTLNELSTLLTNTYETGSEDTCCVFYGVGRGDWYDRFRVEITKPANTTVQTDKPDIYVMDVYEKQNDVNPDTGADQFEIIETYMVSFLSTRLDDDGESMWIEDIVNRYSRHLNCIADEVACLAAVEGSCEFDIPFLDGALNLENGSTGSLFDANGAVTTTVGDSILSLAYTGDITNPLTGQALESVIDTEDHYFNIVFDGGYSTNVKRNIVELTRDLRQDCIAIIDNGDNVNYQAAYDSRSESGGDTYGINTRYAAIYEPYSKIFDKFTGRYLWMTPVYHMANIIPYTDNIAELWYAPAGFNRATIAQIQELRFSPNLSQRDQFYLKQINPIVKFNVGFTVYGQLTSQVRPTALQDLNIMRLILYIKRALEQFCRFYIFELNDTATWGAISNNISAFLKTVQDRRGLYSFGVTVGASEYDIKAKRIQANITLNPTRVVEQIHLNFFVV